MTSQFSKDYYEVLELEEGASLDDAKSAFRKLARKYHPDVSSEEGAEEKFKEINEAYQVLGDSELKGSYDRWRESEVESEGAVHVESSAVNFNVNTSQAEAEAMGFMSDTFSNWTDFTNTMPDDDVFDVREGDFYRMNYKMGVGDNPTLSRSYEVKINGQWHDLDKEEGDVWQVLRQWRDLMEGLLFKVEKYTREGGYLGDYGDIETAFENLNMFLFSRGYLATMVWMNQSSPEGGFRDVQKVGVCRYEIHDFEAVSEAQRYYAEHVSEMPVPPVDPHRRKKVIWGDEGDQDREGNRARIIFGDARETEASDGINIPTEGSDGDGVRIVWGDEEGDQIRWGVEREGRIQWGERVEGGIEWGEREDGGSSPEGGIKWG